MSAGTGPRPGKCFVQPDTPHSANPLVEYTCEDGDPLGVVGETAPLSAETTALDSRDRQPAPDRGGCPRFLQAAPAASPKARTARRPAAPAAPAVGSSPHSVDSRLTVPPSRSAVTNGRGSSSRIAPTSSRTCSGGRDIAREEDHPRGLNPFENDLLFGAEGGAGKTDDQGHGFGFHMLSRHPGP